MSDSENITADADCVANARAFAIAAHGTQEYAGRPYVFHLDAVAKLLEPYGVEAQVIGYLHDVAEDTPTPLQRIRQTFGDRVAECVRLVTDEPGENRAARKKQTNAKLTKVQGEATLALIVKAADRLANLRTSAMSAAAGDSSKLEMYRREHPAFRAAALRPGLCDALWAEMDRVLERPPVG